MAVSKRIRYEILRRDNNTCRYCHATDSPLTVDHVVPVALGGSDDPSNLVAACKDCNAGKTSSSPDGHLVAQVADDAVRWSAAMRAAADEYVRASDKREIVYGHLYDHWNAQSSAYRWGRAEIGDDYGLSVDQWTAAGAPVRLMEEAITRAMQTSSVSNQNVWRYTCGIVWTRVKQMQETAAAALRDAADEGPDLSEYFRGRKSMMLTPEVALPFLQYSHLAALVDGIRYGSVQA